MYICICHGISDRTIRKALDNGARHYRDIADGLGAGSCCGLCVADVKSLIREHGQQKTGSGKPVFFQPQPA
ncbi:MAG: (2Fe-2S)-binding protein [Cardiobacteriaceae bacterium]|nr:(2Fe-2S)-binding protein [Cardiobacteriaceae bacterium]